MSKKRTAQENVSVQLVMPPQLRRSIKLAAAAEETTASALMREAIKREAERVLQRHGVAA